MARSPLEEEYRHLCGIGAELRFYRTHSELQSHRVLVSHLQPGLVPRISTVDGMIGAGHFRAAVAPVYLRRNQDDVLQELPPRVETQEWVELTSRDLEAYRDAVAAGNFMAAR